MKPRIFTTVILLFFSLCGCSPKSDIVGLWELDQSATTKEGLIPNQLSFYRIRFKNDGATQYESRDGSYSLGVWKSEAYLGPKAELPEYLRTAKANGHQVFINQIFLVYQGLTYNGGYSHNDTFYQSYYYFNDENQLVCFDPNYEEVIVLNKIEFVSTTAIK